MRFSTAPPSRPLSRADGSIAGTQARVLDFDAPDKNDWLAVNQFTVAEGQHTRGPDVVRVVGDVA